jgi:hypothetical protein
MRHSEGSSRLALMAARRAACTSPHICFEFGEDVVCPPCENRGEAILAERKRCTTIVARYCDKVSIGGNHLASALIRLGCYPESYRSYEQVLEYCGEAQADIWLAWKAIIELRDCAHDLQKVGGADRCQD